MTDFEKEEFWKSLGRLYDTAQEHTKQIELLLATAKEDGENIRALARIADLPERRLTGLEGGDQQ